MECGGDAWNVEETHGMWRRRMECGGDAWNVEETHGRPQGASLLYNASVCYAHRV